MTIPDLVQRVKTLNQSESANQVEKFVHELLGPDKRGEIMFNYLKRTIRAKLKTLK